MSTYNIKRGASQTSPVKCDVSAGDRVKHKKFGEGMVLSAKPQNGDTQLEIAFDNVGTKTLMASFAKLIKI